MKSFDRGRLNEALVLLENRLHQNHCGIFRIVVCGGSALIATRLVWRTTKDVDVLAMLDDKGSLIEPEPLPECLVREVAYVANRLGLDEQWFNTGPVDLFRMGLPDGFENRLHHEKIGPTLFVAYIGRVDQIHFKLYAAVDRGGYHITDLLALKPSIDEIVAAAEWSMTHDVSDGYRQMLLGMLKQLGYTDATGRI